MDGVLDVEIRALGSRWGSSRDSCPISPGSLGGSADGGCSELVGSSLNGRAGV